MMFFQRTALGSAASAGVLVGAIGLVAGSQALAAGAAAPAAPAAASSTAAPAPAQSGIAPGAAAAAAPRESVTESLIRLLAEHNAISRRDAEDLIVRLQAEQAVQNAPVVAAPAPAAPTAAAVQPPSDGAVHVFYVPDSEKKRIREEVRNEVVMQAKAEGWANVNQVPEWLGRFTLSGDIRVRQENDSYSSDNEIAFLNFQALNAGAPVNINPAAGQATFPFLNVTEDRHLQRLRARFGINARVTNDLDAQFRVATGSASNPVSTNVTFGPDFNKVSLLLDRAFLDWRPLDGAEFRAGRMPNPLITTDMVFDEDLNLDGIAGQYRLAFDNGFAPWITVGLFSVENTPTDSPASFATKVGSRDKSLVATQIGAAWKVRTGLDLRAAVAYLDYNHVEGELKDCLAALSSDSCASDTSRPGFIQKGNTLFAIRHNVPADTNPFFPDFQYFGLASNFEILDTSVEVDYSVNGPLHLVFTADYANNLAYDEAKSEAKIPVNNLEGAAGVYDGGSDAWLVQLLVGYPKVVNRWDWNFTGSYRRIESDAVLDAFTDSDFHLGGTNARGYGVASQLAFTKNAWITLRWLSAHEISGPPLSIDTFYIDLNARF